MKIRTILILLTALLAACGEASTPTLSAGNTATEDAHSDAAQLDDTSPRRRSDAAPTELADTTPGDAEADVPACACDDGNPCTIDICLTDGTCDTDLPPAGTACPGGVCVAGECVAPDVAAVEVADSAAAPDAGDAAVAPDTVDAGAVQDAPATFDAADIANIADTADAAEAGADVQPDTQVDAQGDAPLQPDTAAQADTVAEVAQGDTQAGDAGQVPPDVGSDAPAADVDAQAQGDAVGAADVAPDTNPDSGQVCGCPGDTLALMGDCSVPGTTQVVGNVGSVPGMAGAAYHFADGISGPRKVALVTAGVNLAGDFTIQAWVRLTAYVDRSGIVSTPKFWEGGQSLALYSSFGMDQKPTLFLCSAAFKCYSITGSTQLPLGAWVHVAVVKKASQVRLFLAGQPSPSLGWDGSLSDAVLGMWVGSGGAQGDNHDLPGDLDSVRVTPSAAYWDAFTPTQVCAP